MKVTKSNDNEPDVTKEDQGYINEFSRIFTKNKVLDGEIKKIKEIQNSLSDALAAVDENFGGDPIKLNIGESFINVSDDDATEYIKRQEAKYVEEIKKIVAKYDANKKRLDDLKIILYAKFGKAIHLEEE